MSDFWIIVITETLIATIIGTLLHFTYGWSHENKFVGIFSAVNESTWEHIKLALSGIFCCILLDIHTLGSYENYWLARSCSFLVPVLIIPLLFYTYRALLRVKSCLPIDILIFILATFLSALAFSIILLLPSGGPRFDVVVIIISVIILSSYLLLTRFPLHIFLFKDPLTNKYGYAGFLEHQHRPAARKAGHQNSKTPAKSTAPKSKPKSPRTHKP